MLKSVEVKEVMQKQCRWYPQKALFRDVLKSGNGTELIIEEIEFNAEIPDRVFSRASLRR